MSSTAKSLEEVLERTGFTARVEARGEAKGEARGLVIGEERKALDIAQNMVNLGFPPETVVSVTRLDMERVKELYKK